MALHPKGLASIMDEPEVPQADRFRPEIRSNHVKPISILVTIRAWYHPSGRVLENALVGNLDKGNGAEEGIRTPGEMLHRFSRPAPWARLSYLRLTHPMVGAYLIIVQEQAPHEATCGLSCR